MAQHTPKSPVVGIHQDRHGWCRQYKAFADQYGLRSVMLNLFSDDWVSAVMECDAILFKGTMYPESIRILKERAYFIETFLGKTAVPNWNSYWHFDSKAIQRDIFQVQGLTIPETIVTGIQEDIDRLGVSFPEKVVLKETSGAGSSQVRLICNSQFSRWRLGQWQLDSTAYRGANVILRSLQLRPARGPQKIVQRMIENDGFDIRVTTIGNRHAYLFRRLCRDNDFRASGSGRIDYTWDDRYLELIRALVDFSDKMGFNTMAYDVIAGRDGHYYVIEMSASFDEKALEACPNVFRTGEDRVNFERTEPTSPLELQITMLIENCCRVPDKMITGDGRS